MNQLFITGNLVRDPESRTTQTGKQVTSFTVAVNRRRTANAGQPEADYFRVNAWGQLADSCAKYLSKGRKVAVTGSVSVSTYQAQNGEARANMEVLAQDVEFLSPAEKPAEKAPETPKTDKQCGYVKVEEQLPF